jgi:predicted transcriptional regulator
MREATRNWETEWASMKIVWSQAPCLAGKIITTLQKVDPSKHPRTAQAFLNPLVKKEVLENKKKCQIGSS